MMTYGERTASVEPNVPSMKVVSWEHIPENGEVAARAVGDCSVVAIELVGFRDAQERLGYDAAATTFASADTTEDEKRQVQEYLQRRSPPEIVSLLNALKGTGKRIVTIDVNEGETGQEQALKGIGLFEKAEKTVHRLPSRKTKKLLHKAAGIEAGANREREAEVMNQLQELAAQYENTNTKIGVLVGADHTPALLRELTQLYPTERSFAKRRHVGQVPQERLYFPPDSQMSRHYRFSPDTSLPDDVADRAVLHTVQQAAFREGVANSAISRARRLENVSNAEISDIVLALDGMKAGLRARLRPKRTLAKMDAAIETKLAEIEDKSKYK